jgi:hypothetical protein
MKNPRKNFSIQGRIEVPTTLATAAVEAPFAASQAGIET